MGGHGAERRRGASVLLTPWSSPVSDLQPHRLDWGSALTDSFVHL